MTIRLLTVSLFAYLIGTAVAGDGFSDTGVSGDNGLIMVQSRGQDRRGNRDDRRDDRHGDRDDRQDCRQDEGRVGDDKRECKQENRGEDEDAEAEADKETAA